MTVWTQIAKITSPSTGHLIYVLDNLLRGLQSSFVNWAIIIGLLLGLNEVTLTWTWMSLPLKLSIKVNHYPFRMVPLGTIGRVMEISRILLEKKKSFFFWSGRKAGRTAQGCYHRAPGLTAARRVDLWSSLENESKAHIWGWQPG